MSQPKYPITQYQQGQPVVYVDQNGQPIQPVQTIAHVQPSSIEQMVQQMIQQAPGGHTEREVYDRIDPCTGTRTQGFIEKTAYLVPVQPSSFAHPTYPQQNTSIEVHQPKEYKPAIETPEKRFTFNQMLCCVLGTLIAVFCFAMNSRLERTQGRYEGYQQGVDAVVSP